MKVNHWVYLFMVRDFPVFEIEYINLNDNSPTAVTLTEVFSPAPTLLVGTQVYVPSDITVTLKIPELLVFTSIPLKYKLNWASGLASDWHVNLRGLLRSTVVLLGSKLSFAPPGASKKKKIKAWIWQRLSSTASIGVSSWSVVFSLCGRESSHFFYCFCEYTTQKNVNERINKWSWEFETAFT